MDDLSVIFWNAVKARVQKVLDNDKENGAVTVDDLIDAALYAKGCQDDLEA